MVIVPDVNSGKDIMPIISHNANRNLSFDLMAVLHILGYLLRYRIMNNITLSDLTLDDLLPHRGHMMLLDKVLEVDSKHALTLCRVKKSWPMADETGVHPLILIELAAQTAGVCNGLDRIQTQGIDSDQMGWLVGVKKTEFFISTLPFDSEIMARAENTYNFENLREVSCQLHLDNTLICTSLLQLFQA
jgi:predicted hotdog family 3-hydroxylacyl-ACP dehydratase